MRNHSNSSDRSQSSKIRQAFCGGFVLCAFLVTAFTQYRAQVSNREDILPKRSGWSAFTASAATKSRGTIWSSDGYALAETATGYRIRVIFGRCPRIPAFFVELGEAMGVSSTYLQDRSDAFYEASREYEALESPTQEQTDRKYATASFVLDDLVSNEVKTEIAAVKRRWRADGISIETIEYRRYPLREAAAGVTGRFNHEGNSLGLERSKDNLLSNDDIELTIDSKIQLAAFEAIRQAAELHKASSAAAVVINSRNGELVALADWPTFDPEKPLKRSGQINYAAGAIFEPGSTFKALTLAQGLETGAVSLDSDINCEGFITVAKKPIRCDLHGGKRAHGLVDNEMAIAKSCNVSAAQWSMAIGAESMREMLDSLGVMEAQSIGLPTKSKALFKDKPGSILRQTAELGFGQSISVTPLAAASAFVPIASDGMMWPVSLIRNKTTSNQGNRIFAGSVAKQVLSYMESVVQKEEGTADNLQIPGYRIAGKTGTAQKIGSGGGYNSSFVGILPADDPQYVIYVVVEAANSRPLLRIGRCWTCL